MKTSWPLLFAGPIIFLHLFCFYLLKRVSDLEEITFAMRANAAERTEVMKTTSDVLDGIVESLQRIVHIMQIKYNIEEEEID